MLSKRCVVPLQLNGPQYLSSDGGKNARASHAVLTSGLSDLRGRLCDSRKFALPHDSRARPPRRTSGPFLQNDACECQWCKE